MTQTTGARPFNAVDEIEALKARVTALEPMRCAECDCKRGGEFCNWIAPGPLSLTALRRDVDALMGRVDLSEVFVGADEPSAADLEQAFEATIDDEIAAIAPARNLTPGDLAVAEGITDEALAYEMLLILTSNENYGLQKTDVAILLARRARELLAAGGAGKAEPAYEVRERQAAKTRPYVSNAPTPRGGVR